MKGRGGEGKGWEEVIGSYVSQLAYWFAVSNMKRPDCSSDRVIIERWDSCPGRDLQTDLT